jgi:hypothetical protein
MSKHANVQVNYMDEENLVDEIELDELLDELKNETEEEEVQQVSKTKPCRTFYRNFYRSWNKPKAGRSMVVRFQKLAGIISDKTVAALILPDGRRIEFKSLPHWWDVIRYKLAGFTYETYLN